MSATQQKQVLRICADTPENAEHLNAQSWLASMIMNSERELNSASLG
jgi:hypothetical protein